MPLNPSGHEEGVWCGECYAVDYAPGAADMACRSCGASRRPGRYATWRVPVACPVCAPDAPEPGRSHALRVDVQAREVITSYRPCWHRARTEVAVSHGTD